MMKVMTCMALFCFTAATTHAEDLNKAIKDSTAAATQIPAKVADYQKLNGDAQRGRRAFENGDYNCNSCHGIARGEAGVGPSLWDVGARRNRLELAIAIIDPNATVAPAYQKVTLVKNDGAVLTGQIVHRDELNRRTQLRDANGQIHLVDDKDVEERATSPSEMPQDIVDLIPSSQAFADLIDFLAGLRPKSGVKTQTGVTQ